MRVTRGPALLLLAIGAAAATAVAYAARTGTGQLATKPTESAPSVGSDDRDEPLAPELTGAVAWLNTDHPIRMDELRGRVVILDFWTYGCINCMHVIPALRKLEAKREGQPLEVIGVHSAKFENEKAADHVRAAAERYGLTHPIAVDSDMAIWDRYGVQAWPTVVVIRPNGHVAGAIPGEVTFEALDALVGKLMDDARSRGELAAGPALPHTPPPRATGELSYPGKVIAVPDGRLFIADSRHHRVVITAADGRILDIAGSGVQGRQDGSFESAELDDPQGMALDGDTLYLADARGYAVLALDSAHRTVRAVAGTGKLGQAPLGKPVRASTAALRSPWDVLLVGTRLFVAMAGSHQIGVIDLGHDTLAAFSGSGREDIEDGPAKSAAFAQPSGLSLGTGGNKIYVADSESSGVRAIDLGTGAATTLLGTGLFDWGDREGPIGPKMIQHPLAVAASGGGLWIADTYNGKIKRLSRDGATLTTVVTQSEGKPLSEPGGLWVDRDGSLLIADTGNGRILRLPTGGGDARAVAVGRRSEAPQAAGETPNGVSNAGSVIRLAPLSLPSGSRSLPLTLVAPRGFAFSDGAPWTVELSGAGPARSASGEAKAGERIATGLEPTLGQGPAGSEMQASVHANVCDAVTHSACYPIRARYAIALSEAGAAGRPAEAAAELDLPLPAPK